MKMNQWLPGLNEMNKLVISIVVFFLIPFVSHAGDDPPNKPIVNVTLLQSSTSWDGGSFNYPEGKPQITVSTITVPEGVSLAMHCHPVPLAGMVVKGTLEVTTANGESRIFEEGEAVIEVFNTWHYGKGLSGDTELFVVYMGAEGMPVTVLMDGDPEQAKLCRTTAD